MLNISLLVLFSKIQPYPTHVDYKTRVLNDETCAEIQDNKYNKFIAVRSNQQLHWHYILHGRLAGHTSIILGFLVVTLQLRGYSYIFTLSPAGTVDRITPLSFSFFDAKYAESQNKWSGDRLIIVKDIFLREERQNACTTFNPDLF